MTQALAYSAIRNFSSTIAGRFEVLRCLGVGSVGAVYLCRDLDLLDTYSTSSNGIHSTNPSTAFDPLVAVKVLTLGTLRGPRRDAVIERFVEEARILERVNHPNVVRFKELVMDDAECAIAMEFVRGGNLKTIMLRQATKLAESFGEDYQGAIFPIGVTVRLLADICRGLQAIHDAGYVHRDIKPENILISVDGSIKLSDLSSALPIGDNRSRGYEVSGTIEFMSPEFLQSGLSTPEGDVYGVGMMAYQLITGTLPFQAPGIYGSVNIKLSDEPTPPEVLNPECSMLLSDLVSWSLRREIKERCPSPSAMLEVLESLLYAYPVARGDGAISELGTLDDAFIDDDLVALHDESRHGDQSRERSSISTQELIANPNLVRTIEFEKRRQLVMAARRQERLNKPARKDKLDLWLRVLILILAIIFGAALYLVSRLFFFPHLPHQFPMVFLAEELR